MNKRLTEYLHNLPRLAAAGLINLPLGEITPKGSDPNSLLPALANRLADIMSAIAYPLAFVGIVYSVYLLIANSGNPDAFKTTKKNIVNIAGGIFLLVFSVILFNFVANIFN
ncbi:MAG TPA: hypothetical protein VLA04_04055 [Verrucomicrobiae bacterium]|nr:hypothetical protein [Verrucomicrobiae bacterium]